MESLIVVALSPDVFGKIFAFQNFLRNFEGIKKPMRSCIRRRYSAGHPGNRQTSVG